MRRNFRGSAGTGTRRPGRSVLRAGGPRLGGPAPGGGRPWGPAFFVLLLGIVLQGCGGGETDGAQPVPPDSARAVDRGDGEFLARAKAASNRFRLALQHELRAAMAEGGPVAAIEVCHQRAREIAREQSEDGLALRRVSTRERNPANRADPTEAAILARFEAEPARQDTVFVRDGHRVYMKAIRIGSALCLRCHGPQETLDPALRARLAELYPADRATGFGMGDLRGAFVVQD